MYGLHIRALTMCGIRMGQMISPDQIESSVIGLIPGLLLSLIKPKSGCNHPPFSRIEQVNLVR